MSEVDFQSGEPLAELEQALQAFPDDASGLPVAQSSLQAIAESAREAGQADVARFASTINGLIDLLDAESASDPESAGELADFIQGGLAPLRAALQGDDNAASDIQAVLETVEQRWGEYLALMAPDTALDADDPWSNDFTERADSWDGNASEPDGPESSSAEIAEMLASLTTLSPEQPAAEPAEQETAGEAADAPDEEPAPRRKPEMFGATSGDLPDSPPAPAAIEMDADLLEAYAEDARAGAARLEQVVFELESRPDDADLHRSVCRELHTLKGASASVGLTDLADYLHRVEDYVEASKGQTVQITPMLQSVDAVRRQLEALTGPAPPESAGDEPDGRGDRPSATAFEPTAGREESLRVKASRVERLMDLLAELVILRNQRDSRLTRLKNLHSELTRCVTRLRVFADGIESGSAIRPRDGGLLDDDGSPNGRVSGSVVEIANDVAEFARSLRDLAEPMEAENVTISHFIRQFRTELMDMRRMPVSGLFQRLNRAARDAARIENKKIEFSLEGEHAGLDRSLQERLYEPLLHIVRNAVSHGVETPDVRRKAGKPEAGTVRLTAHGSPTTLIIEISDDGRGLDFEAIRRRGIDRGLVGVGDPVDEAKLARLIFHPGFSTRMEANAVAGRGVGMDVVAAALQRMRARIDVESRAGAGTTMRLTIPLRSVIEHAMVVCIEGWLFAIPMQFVQAAGALQNNESRPLVRLRSLLGLVDPRVDAPEQVVILGSSRLAVSRSVRKPGQSPESEIALIVDEVIGPDEVVVRTLPSLVKSHPCLGGVTLSGDGNIVQLLDGGRLMDLAAEFREPEAADEISRPDSITRTAITSSPDQAVRALVADDSLSARRRLVKMLKAAGFAIAEAGDGREALDRVRKGDIKIVFTDLEMPHVDGFGVLSEIKGKAAGRSVPVVVVSSRSETDFRERAAELGADDYLVKPVSAPALAETLLKLESQYASHLES